jgi:hypothetical protein
VLDKLRIIRNGHITVIKQDGRVIQIDVCDRFSTGSGPEESFDPPRNNPVNFYENLEGGY